MCCSDRGIKMRILRIHLPLLAVIESLRNDPSSGFADAEAAIQEYSDRTRHEATFVFYRNNIDGSYMISTYYSYDDQFTPLPSRDIGWGFREADLDVPGSTIVAIEHTHPGTIWTGILPAGEGPSFDDATIANQYPNAYMIINKKLSAGFMRIFTTVPP
jgi:hypothetical protein